MFAVAFGSAAFAALSLFLGYFVYQMLIGELDDGVFNLDFPMLLYSSLDILFVPVGGSAVCRACIPSLL